MTVQGQPTVTYDYDDANRLTTATQGTSVVTLTYDDADRRSTLTLPNGTMVSYEYDNAKSALLVLLTRRSRMSRSEEPSCLVREEARTYSPVGSAIVMLFTIIGRGTTTPK